MIKAKFMNTDMEHVYFLQELYLKLCKCLIGIMRFCVHQLPGMGPWTVRLPLPKFT